MDCESRLRSTESRWPVVKALSLVMALVVLASPAFWIANAAAQVDDQTQEELTPAFELAGQSIWIANEDVFRVSLRLLNAPDDSTVDINIGLPIRSRSRFLGSAGRTLHRFGPSAIDPIAHLCS